MTLWDLLYFQLSGKYFRFTIIVIYSFFTFSGSASKIGSSSSSKKPYLSTLSKNALDKLALKAVKAGADINKLKQAAAVAHKSDNWSLLEKEISDALGEDSIKPSGLFG